MVANKFNIDSSRYDEFSYLCYLDVEDIYIQNYVLFHLGKDKPNFKNRLASHFQFWVEFNSPEWLLNIIKYGISIPFESSPPENIFAKF